MATEPFPETKVLRERAHSLCTGLFFRLDEFVDDFPTGIPRNLIEVVQSLLRELQSIADEEDDPEILWDICSVLEFTEPEPPGLSQSLDWLDNAHTAQTPSGLVQLLRVASKQMGLPGDFLVAPDHELNYSILDFIRVWRELLSDLLDTKELDEIFKALPATCYVVRFPRITRENVLSHAILGHELGHPIAEDFLAQYKASAAYQKKVKQVTSAIRSELQKQSKLNNVDLAAEQPRAFRKVDALFHRAIEELISDSVAVFTFGPSALFAFYDLFIGGDYDAPPNEPYEYPPDRYRIRLMLELVKEKGHLAVLTTSLQHPTYLQVRKAVREMLSHLESLASETSDLEQLKYDPWTRIAYDWLKQSLPKAVDYARSRVKNFMYEADVIKKEIPDLIKLLKIGVPPAERGAWPDPVQVDWRSSLLAGWCMRLDLIAKNTAPGAKLETQMRELSDLTMKGIEYSILRQEYSQTYPEAVGK
jgi:hypothetical protein